MKTRNYPRSFYWMLKNPWYHGDGKGTCGVRKSLFKKRCRKSNITWRNYVQSRQTPPENRIMMVINYKLKQCKWLIKGNRRINRLSRASRVREMQKTFKNPCEEQCCLLSQAHPHGSIDQLLNADGKIINSGGKIKKKWQKCSIAISALHLERREICTPYDVADGVQHLPSGTKEDVRQYLLKLNVFHIIWPGYLCVLKEPAKMLNEVLYLQI